MSDENKIRDAADAVKGIIKEVPVYQDALQPAAKEVGLALQTVSKAIHVALAPVSVLVWGYEELKNFLSSKLAEKLSSTPIEEIQTPAVNVAAPTLAALRYSGYEDDLREMYANLLAASMDKTTGAFAHPSFVEIIKQMTPDEAKLMRLFAQVKPFPVIDLVRTFEAKEGSQCVLRHFSLLGHEADCANPDQTPSYIDNLCRLGLIELPAYAWYANQGVYDVLERHDAIVKLRSDIQSVQGCSW